MKKKDADVKCRGTKTGGGKGKKNKVDGPKDTKKGSLGKTGCKKGAPQMKKTCGKHDRK